MRYIPVIGMEVHVELKTASKMFCDCINGMGQEQEPNVNICPVCTGQPGTLPVPNRQAIEFVHRAGLALNCILLQESKFDRKNYFYPDLPKGYQISQFEEPLCGRGYIELDGETIGITRIHMEEDTGKLEHKPGYTLVDLNRAGVPLMELVTEPDIATGTEARFFCQKLQQIFRYIGISDADMEKGQMRCEVNISLHKEGEEKLSGTKVEIKNLNSFKTVEKAVNYEIIRQTDVLLDGGVIIQETRGWDDVNLLTVSQRAKEAAHDYRYFPEPDIPPMVFTNEYFLDLRRHLPELPAQRLVRFIEEYEISSSLASVVISNKLMADYFENVVSELYAKSESKEILAEIKKCIKLAANYLVSELQKYLVKEKQSIADIKISPENFAELIGLIADGVINSSAAQSVLFEMYYGDDDDPSHIVEQKNLAQENNSETLLSVVDGVLNSNKQSVSDYNAGKENAIKFLMGQVMKETGGRANPQAVMEILRQRLS